MDAVLLHQHGIKETVATMGTALTEKQFSLLRGRLDKVYLVFDADSGGETAALRGLELLKNEGCYVEVAQLPRGQDPADFIREHGEKVFRREILAQARPFIDYRLYSVKKNYDLEQEKGRVEYWKEARKILNEIQVAVEREEYLKKIASEINVSLEVLRGDLENTIQGFPNKKKGKKGILQEASKGASLKELVEKELLSCILRQPRYLKKLNEFEISAENFTEEPYRRIAAKIFELQQQGKKIDTVALLNYFSDREEHKLITRMAIPDGYSDESRADKVFRDCTKRIRALCWAEERETLIKSLANTVDRKEMSAKLQRISNLKKREEEFYRSAEGEDSDV